MFDRKKSTPIEQETYNFLHCVVLVVVVLVYAYRSCLSGRKNLNSIGYLSKFKIFLYNAVVGFSGDASGRESTC